MTAPEKGARSALLFSAAAPDDTQKRRFEAWLRRSYGRELELEWVETPELTAGFRLQVGSEVYDWSPEGRIEQLRDSISAMLREGELIPLLRDTIERWQPEVLPHDCGTVISTGDGIAVVDGLEKAAYGEIILFESGVKGMVQDLSEDRVGCMLFGDAELVSAGSRARRSGRSAGMPVGDGFLGRVVDALGSPIDGLGPIRAEGFRPIESPAPGIIERKAVSRPMETGILAIDSMFPIGRGQRELIIGDRQTGKTSIALDTILNQKGKDTVCIYVAIGQKASSLAHLVEILRSRGCMDYCVVLCANASELSSLQYIAPYAGCALGEYFMNKGRDVLIVYDDLSKHAIAYRALSLLLERSPGREAYPGDVFYLHSRLLERSAQLSDERGGGSMTALPIVETQAGNVSAYIPTNIISITDGQIFLETELFHSGQRPAVNVGLSVSRVGGAAQTKAMKIAAGTLRLDLAQYREMEVFTQFSSDLDEATRRSLDYGRSLLHMLRQDRSSPLSMTDQVILLVAVLGKTMVHVPLRDMDSFRAALLEHMHAVHGELCGRIGASGVLSPDDRESILLAARRFADEAYPPAERS